MVYQLVWHTITRSLTQAALSANHIAENLFAQVDDEGNCHVLMHEIIDHRTNGQEVKQQDAFLTTKMGTKRCRETTKGWELLVEWKDGSTTWVALKDMKESFPVQVSEYTVACCIAMEPAFAWWMPTLSPQSDRGQNKVKVLGTDPQVWHPNTKVCQGGH